MNQLASVASTDPATVKEPAPAESVPALSVSEDVAKEDLLSAPDTNANNAAPPSYRSNVSNTDNI